MLELTDDAVEAIKGMLEAEGGAGLRIAGGSDDGEEAGFGLSVEGAPAAGDEVVERDGARVYLDAGAAALLADKLLSVHAHGDHFHFEILDRDA